MSAPIRLLICDDHRIVRQGLRQLFADTPDIVVVAEADSGVQAIERAREQGLEVVLLDIAMPQRDGLETLARLRKEWPRLPVLILSTYPERQYAVRCLRLGAAGYLNKAADTDEILGAVRKAAAGGRWVSAATAEALAASLVPSGTTECAHERLSRREYQVFQCLAQGLAVSQIAERLNLSPNTVSTYRARVLEKTGTRNDVELALYAVKEQLFAV